ncbi:MAG: TonB-dependent receptor, partial [Rhizobacter sp.]
MQVKSRPYALTAIALAAVAAVGHAQAQAQAPAPAQAASQPAAQAKEPTVTLDKVVVTAKRERRVSKGATNLPLEIKDTPQSISTIDKDDLTDFGVTDSVNALRYGTGINVEQWETNRTNFNSRGFDVMLTQVDGLGMTNEWGIVTGNQDAFLFERIELVRGANGLLTGTGNSSGTINYVRKRPTNKDGGTATGTIGSHDFRRLAVDYNKVLTPDGAWAARLVMAGEDKDSHIRALQDRRGTVYGVVEGQIGSSGVLTIGAGYSDNQQRSPMWGSLVVNRTDGSQVEFDSSASTSQDWTYWNTRAYNAFVEYTHAISSDWEGKLTYNHRRGVEDSKLFYASGALTSTNTGLFGFSYRGEGVATSNLLDGNLVGRFDAFGRKHEVTVGLSHSKQEIKSYNYEIPGAPPYPGTPLPAFPYAGNIFPEPTWGAKVVASDGSQELTRFYGATRLSLTDRLKGIVGFNAINLVRDGSAIYGSSINLDNEKTQKISPYAGATYDITPDVLAYTSYSDIYQVQDQRNISGGYVDPMKGVNTEVGVKAEWLDRKLLTTFAVFQAEQQGLAVIGGLIGGFYWYEPKDVKSRGFELEVTGRLSADTKLTVGYTQLKLTGVDGAETSQWVPRRTMNLRADTRVPFLTGLRLGVGARWQSDVFRVGGARQDSYL